MGGSIRAVSDIVGQIRRHWPRTRINIRGDSGFCRDSLMKWCEDHGVGFVLGLARNRRLVRALGGAMHEAHGVHRRTGKPVRRLRDFTYRTRKSWSRKRRVVGKAEYLSKGENPRFVVTNLSARKAAARRLYEKLYCARGDMENRIKEQQLDLFADRTSAHTMRANQLRLYFSSFAYVLMHALRRLGTDGTQFARAQCATLRLKLLKVGVRVKITARRVWLSFSQAYPYAKTHLYHPSDNLSSHHAVMMDGAGVWHYKCVLEDWLHDRLADPSRGGVDSQRVVDRLLGWFGASRLAHVQGAPVGATEGRGDALLSFEDAP